MKDLLLKISDLEIKTGKKTLVNNVSLGIYRKTITGLVGESGSGKTLTALSVLRLLPAGVETTAGNISFYDASGVTDLLSVPMKQLNKIRGNRISMIFQEPMSSLNPSMKCGKQAMEPLLKMKGHSASVVKEKILHLFDEVRLPNPKDVFHAWPHELSGGQRQRVMIATALATSPDLLIADEPTTALDVTVQKNILNLLGHLKEKYNLSILFITHDLMVLKQIADEVAVMRQGEIIERGGMKNIMEKPSTPYAKGLLACRPGLENQPVRLPTVDDFVDPENRGWNHKTRLPDKAAIPIQKEGEILLRIENLHVNFSARGRSVKAVNNVSFNVYRGETLGLVGESGCGKTTLGRTILQLIHADSGSVFYQGRSLNKLNAKTLRKIRKNIQIVFQDPYSSLNPIKTVGSIITEPIVVHHLAKGKTEAREMAHRLLEQVGLPADSFNLYPHQFSGGQRQRIGIARALACRPEFIILDESVSSLDVSIQAQILNLLNDLKEEYDLTYIFISHDLTVVKYMSDRVMVMSDGKIIESGTSEQIYLQPSEDYTRELIATIPV
ncbi:MAG: ABC transporter ATP-binding protein [Bacteroidales bacterium]